MPDVAEYLEGVLNGEFSADQRAFIARLLTDYLADYHPLPKEEFRIAAQRCLRVLIVIDSIMSNSHNPDRSWKEISIALGLPSACLSGITELAIASGCISKRADTRGQPLTKMAISKQVRRFLKLAELKPAFGQGGRLQ